jgi:hypothetical protein
MKSKKELRKTGEHVRKGREQTLRDDSYWKFTKENTE